jgi:hypothetical protein
MNIEIDVAPDKWRAFKIMAIRDNKTVAVLTAEVIEDAIYDDEMKRREKMDTRKEGEQ